MIEIKTSRTVLRELKIDDAKDIAKNISDYDIIQWLERVPWPYTLDDAKSWIENGLKKNNGQFIEEFKLGIEINNNIVGSIGVHDIIEGHKGEIGYWLSKKHQGKGIMTEVLTVFIEHIVKKFNLIRVQAKVFEENIASQRTLEKQGFEKEGLMIKGAKPRGELVNVYTYAKIIK